MTTHRQTIMRQVLEAIDTAGMPVRDAELPARAASFTELCQVAIGDAVGAGYVLWSERPAGWVIQPSGQDYLTSAP
jgi:hypothetical protein